jgi:uncharacterized protein
MRKLLSLLAMLFLLVVSGSAQNFPEQPTPQRLVNDFSGTLSPDETQRLEAKLVAFNDSTSVQIAIVMIRTLEGYPASDYAFKLGEKWGIGQAKSDNGVLLLIAMEDRELFIATGYGVEATLTDALCRRIIESDIKPFFREQKFYEGIDKGASQMMSAVKGDYKPLPPRKQKGQKGIPFFGVILIFFLIVFMLRILGARQHAQVNNIPFWTAWMLLNAARRRSSGGYSSGWGGGFGGGSGGFGGGGFGGFGGGSFGGGGAGGKW